MPTRRNVGRTASGSQTAQDDTTAKAFEELRHRLTAVEYILRTLAQKGEISLDDVVETLSTQQGGAPNPAGQEAQSHIAIPSAVVTQIQRILEWRESEPARRHSQGDMMLALRTRVPE
jgi:two-component sensor histidine kinase